MRLFIGCRQHLNGNDVLWQLLPQVLGHCGVVHYTVTQRDEVWLTRVDMPYQCCVAVQYRYRVFTVDRHCPGIQLHAYRRMRDFPYYFCRFSTRRHEICAITGRIWFEAKDDTAGLGDITYLTKERNRNLHNLVIVQAVTISIFGGAKHQAGST